MGGRRDVTPIYPSESVSEPRVMYGLGEGDYA